MILQLNPPIPLLCQAPWGEAEGLAHFLVNNGIEAEDMWVVFFPVGVWWIPNSKVKPCVNWSVGRGV